MHWENHMASYKKGEYVCRMCGRTCDTESLIACMDGHRDSNDRYFQDWNEERPKAKETAT